MVSANNTQPALSANRKNDLFTRVQRALLLAYAASLPISMTLSWGLLIAGLILLAAQILLAVFAHRGNRERGCGTLELLAGAPLLKPLLVFTAAVALSGFMNGGITEALSSAATLRAILCYFWAYSVFAFNRRITQTAIFVLLSVGAVAGVFGAIEQLANFHPLGYRYLQGTGFLGGPMSFAGQMEMLASLAVALLFVHSSKINAQPDANNALISGKYGKSLLLLLATGNCLGVIFAAERSSWLGFLATLAAISIALSWRRFITVMAAVWALAFLGWLTVPVFQKRLLPLLSWQNDVSVRVRLFLWQKAVALWQHNPVFGIGFRKFPHFNMPEAIVPGRSIDINHAHSNYLQILATTGIVGLFAYLWLWWRVLLLTWNNYRNSLPRTAATSSVGSDVVAVSSSIVINNAAFEHALALGIFGGTIALLVSGAFEYNFGAAHVRLMQWFLLAMLLPAQKNT